MDNSLLSSLSKLLSFVFADNFSENMLPQYKDLFASGVLYQHLKSGETAIDGLSSADHVVTLVSGCVQIHNYGPTGNKSIQGIMDAPEFFGLAEVISNMESYFSSVIACTPVTIIVIPKELFLNTLRTSTGLSSIVIEKLAYFSALKMSEGVERNIYKPIDTFILFLYKYAKNSTLPATVELKRAELADLLHIDLRTLYRYQNLLKSKGLCTAEHGKIRIDQGNLHNLESYINEFGLE